ncbi:MAG: hypothetical protein KDD70_17635 [Bdellovibrionales bacterium]|nr:hypothetical protein [Bdellovibrionales bacterium]
MQRIVFISAFFVFLGAALLAPLPVLIAQKQQGTQVEVNTKQTEQTQPIRGQLRWDVSEFR